MLRFAAGAPVYVDKSSYRDAYNALLGKCAESGWYKDGGWMPNGRFAVKCREKDKGDILGVCATLPKYGSTQIWLYCDKTFEESLVKDFAEPEDVIRHPFTIKNWLIDMKRIPDKRWLDAFCERTHDPDAFSMRHFGRALSPDDVKDYIERLPKMEKYIKTMWRL